MLEARMSSLLTPTPQERLAISRKAIVRTMNRDRPQGHDDADPVSAESGESWEQMDGNWGIFKQAVKAWWHHHPANLALDVAKPLLGEYARIHPVKLLGISAGIGAMAVLLKPWRLVSLGGVLLATMKSSDISGVVHSMLSASAKNPDNPDNAR
jgi:hypothetical protein